MLKASLLEFIQAEPEQIGNTGLELLLNKFYLVISLLFLACTVHNPAYCFKRDLFYSRHNYLKAEVELIILGLTNVEPLYITLCSLY